MENLSRIRKTSQILYLLFTALMFVVPLAVGYYWLTLNGSQWPLPRVVDPLAIRPIAPYPIATLLLGFLVTMLPAAIVMYGFFQLRKLFQLYAAGMIFTAANSKCLKNISIALLAWMPVRIVFDALISALLTFGNPAGERFISISIKEIELTAFLFGLITLVIAWVMGEACKLQEDHAGII